MLRDTHIRSLAKLAIWEIVAAYVRMAPRKAFTALNQKLPESGRSEAVLSAVGYGIAQRGGVPRSEELETFARTLTAEIQQLSPRAASCAITIVFAAFPYPSDEATACYRLIEGLCPKLDAFYQRLIDRYNAPRACK